VVWKVAILVARDVSVSVLVTTMSPAETAGLIEVPFGMCTPVNPGNYVLDGDLIPSPISLKGRGTLWSTYSREGAHLGDIVLSTVWGTYSREGAHLGYIVGHARACLLVDMNKVIWQEEACGLTAFC